MLQSALVLASAKIPPLSQTIAALAQTLSALAPVTVAESAGYSGEVPRIYITVQADRVTRIYGADQHETDIIVLAAIDRDDSPMPDYLQCDLLAAVISSTIAREFVAPPNVEWSLAAARPAASSDQGATIGAELRYTLTFSVDPAEPFIAI
jgi:hypothetical protein